MRFCINDIVVCTSKSYSEFSYGEPIRLIYRLNYYSFLAETLDNKKHARIYRYQLWKSPIKKMKIL